MKLPAIFIIVCSIFSIFGVGAQEIFTKYTKLRGLSANFNYKKEIMSIGVSLVSKGHFKFTRPDYFEWNIYSPNKLSIIYKENTFSIIEDGKPIVASENAKLDQKLLNGIKHIKAFLMLDFVFIKENYLILELPQNKLELTPKNNSLFFKKIQIQMGKENPVDKLTLQEINNDQIVIEFHEAKTSYEK